MFRPCPFYLENRCIYGNRCNNVHTPNPNTPRSNHPICRNFLAGNCRYGRNCRFSHQQPNNQSTSARIPNQSRKPYGVQSKNRWNNSNFALSPNAEPFFPREIKNSGSFYPETSKNWNNTNSDNFSMCPYFEMTGQCFNYDQGNCFLVHGDYCDLCCRFCLNPNDDEQRKSHKRECVAEHERAMKDAFANQLSAEKSCGICMENIYEQAQRFGILNKCKHCYCLRCIRAWRKTTGPVQKEATRSCPQCRIVSDFVIPSELWVEEDEEKNQLIQTYQQNMKQKVCKYMQNGNPDDCPFGNKCFYKHQLPDGRIIESGPPKRRRRSPRNYHNMSLDEFISVMPNVNLIRIGVGEEDNLDFLFEEFQELFSDDLAVRYSYLSSEEEDVPTDEEEELSEINGLDDLFEFNVEDHETHG